MNHSSTNLNLIIVGPSGGGKGTQAKRISEKYDLVHISMGKIFRSQIEKETVYGKKVKSYVEKGQWVPTELVLEGLGMIMEALTYHGFILDGFPRLPDQPKALDQLLFDNGSGLELAIHLKVSDRVIMARRGVAQSQGKSFYGQRRNDESPEAIKSRLEAYHQNIAPILDYYRQKNLLVEIDGERPVETIFEDIVKIIDDKILIK